MIYTKAKLRIVKAEINWLEDNIKVALINNFYNLSINQDEFYGDISPWILLGNQPIKSLTNRDYSNSILFADSLTFNSILPNQTISCLILFKDLDVTNIDGPPNDVESPLLAVINRGYAIGTNGGDIKINWNLTKGVLKLL
jgi:hypothetical protein